jgi:uncharacterized protein YggU (UPF0235/DUF167 family)
MKISVTVKPRSKEARVEKADDTYIAYVKEPPIENRANEAVIKLLADYFDIAKSRVSVLHGVKSKRKVVEIIGL